jgi:DNA ligase-1
MPDVTVVGQELVDLDTAKGLARFKMINTQAVAGGFEGIMIKDPEARYETRRSVAWLKQKPFIEVSLTVVGFEEGTGKNAGKRVNDCEKIKEDEVEEAAKKGLYYNVNKRKKAGTSRDASHPEAPTAQAWKDAAKTAKKDVKEASGHIPTNKKEAEDPRWSNAITVDIGPDEDKKQASKMGFNISDAGPPKLNANGKF